VTPHAAAARREADRFRLHWRGRIAARAASLPARFSRELLAGWDAREGDTSVNHSSVAAANLWANGIAGELLEANASAAYDEERIRALAINYARCAGRLASLEARERFARSLNIEPPDERGTTREGRAARMADDHWWRRRLRRTWTRRTECALRGFGIIRRGLEPYASDQAVEHRGARERRTREWMEAHELRSDEGGQLELLAVHDRSIANPALRRGEFMTRVRGFEEVAQDLGHVAEFVTMTAPSAFHPYLASGGANPRYDGERRPTPRDAHRWIAKQWARIRAKLARLSVLVYGFRVAEPHHDATPHWHALLFVPAHDADRLRFVIRAAMLAEYGDEPGAEAHRVAFERIEAGKGSATGYVAKYVAKNVDAAGQVGAAEDFETGERIVESVGRVVTWASVHGIRQFQQIGGPPVGLWREARRLREAVADRDIERARAAADAGDWRAFVYALSFEGIKAGRRVNVKLERVETGERNHYGELRPARVVGLRCASRVELTRGERWKIEKKSSAGTAERNTRRCPVPVAACGAAVRSEIPPRSGSDSGLGPVAITVRDASAGADWSWVATVPFRPAPARAGWCNPHETSTAGPMT
jgi:hypothetical protein